MNTFKIDIITKILTKNDPITRAYGHLLADVQFAVVAPAFTLSLCDSENARNSQDAHSLCR